MIVFGTRMYGKKNRVTGWGTCDHCGKYGKLSAYNGRKWGHLYFIPIIPEGPRVRVVKECAKCSHGIHLPEKEVPAILHDMRQAAEKALSALIAGEEEFEDDGARKPCVAFLASSVEMFYFLGAKGQVEKTLNALQQNSLNLAYHLVRGELLEISGQTDEAAASYMHAAKCDPDDAAPLTALGSLYIDQKKYREAQVLYERALQLSPEELPIRLVLLSVYDETKEHTKLAETYERCFELVPEMANDKKTRKAYQKACKKAGRQPVMG